MPVLLSSSDGSSPGFAMFLPPNCATPILGHLGEILAKPESDEAKLHKMWYAITYFRAEILATIILQTIGNKVYSGPFKGMALTHATMQGAFAPILLGTYEHELHKVVEQAATKPYRHLLNIGCGYGYYAVGLALKMPHIQVHAYDTDPEEQSRCRAMAELNGVAARIQIGGEFRAPDFIRFENERTLLVMDIEGAETVFLNPDLCPALKRMDIIVELHDVYDRTISSVITERFKDTHEIEIIHNQPLMFDFRPLVGPTVFIDSIDAMAAAWEKRDGPTPWGILKARNPL